MEQKMLGLIREMLHYRNNLGDKEFDACIVGEFEKRYDAILDLGEKEYLDDPPTDYYREGTNVMAGYCVKSNGVIVIIE